jgi:hypothetical protein
VNIEHPDRRRFLTVLSVSLGAAALGGVAWAIDKLTGGTPSVTAAAPVTTTTTAPATTSTVTSTSPTTTTSSTTTSTTLPPSREVEVICRDAWGALPPSGEFAFHDIERITVHHTGALIEDNTESPYFTRRHQRYHQGAELGWPDIAYHFLIDFNGHIYEGRRWDAAGDTRTSYDPTGHLLIAVKGNFEEQIPTDAQLASLYDMLAWGAESFGIQPGEIMGHRDFAATACPGKSLYAILTDGEIAEAVQTRLDTASTKLVEFCGLEAIDLVAAIEAGTA